ncbi:MAG: response regulator [Deltaproteobacteria bacterium]|nr:response regulator [Deltaproteobacteria bacterium]
MDALARLASGITHDFNNILTSINGYAEILVESLPRDHPNHDDAAEIVAAGERAGELIRRLQSFSRKQPRAVRPVDPARLVTDMNGAIGQLAAGGVEVRYEVDADLPRVNGDPELLGELVIELASNAIDAMPDGGALTIGVARRDLTDHACLHCGENVSGAFVELRVADTGAGMNDETRAHLFEPFFTTKDRGRGKGLGLAVVYGITRQHRGHIAIESAPGEGTTARVWLPCDALAVETKQSATTVPIRATGGNETILLVEDNDMVRGLARRTLTRAGYSVFEAGDGERAIEFAGAFPSNLDLLLVDVILPGLSGTRVVQSVLRSRPASAVLFMSGHAEDIVEQDGYLAPGVSFLPKPFTADGLLRKVRQTLDEKRALSSDA